jgi:hypothetical protein
MNKERAAAMLPIITAFAEGKPVQFRTTAKQAWQDATALGFVYEPSNYRIKPDPPRSLFRIEDQDGLRYDGGQYTKDVADKLVVAWNERSTDGRVYRTVEYVEKVDA